VHPTQRFSDRVENYARFRPGYPEAFIRFLIELLPAPATVADIGSGTGILSRQLLQAGYAVLAIEPNTPMRLEAERQLANEAHFHSLAGTAEATTLSDRVVQAVTCAQSFHWFERKRCRVEFERILQAPKLVLLIWNERITKGMMADYDRMLEESAPEYSTVGRHTVTEADIAEFFAPGRFDLNSFPHSQWLDRESFIGRVLSSSYTPNVGQAGHGVFVEKIVAFFECHANAGRIEFPYQTRVYTGQLGSRHSSV
jgi:SAM-dependent methyltransferase